MPLATYILLFLIVVPLLVLVVDIVRMVSRRVHSAASSDLRPTRPATAPRAVVVPLPIVHAPRARAEGSTAIRPGEGMVYRGEPVGRR
jgi:hypothetical protein